MNPVIELVEAGHFQKTVKNKLICRICIDDWPCAPILEARNKVRRLYGTLRPAKKA